VGESDQRERGRRWDDSESFALKIVLGLEGMHMSNNAIVFLFVGSVGLGILAMDTYLIALGKVDPASFVQLAGMLIAGVVGLLAPSPVQPKA
jgi:hypothetical protein